MHKIYMGQIEVLKEKNRKPVITSIDSESSRELKDLIYSSNPDSDSDLYSSSKKTTEIDLLLEDIIKNKPDTIRNGCFHAFLVYKEKEKNKLCIEFNFGCQITGHSHIGKIDDR